MNHNTLHPAVFSRASFLSTCVCIAALGGCNSAPQSQTGANGESGANAQTLALAPTPTATPRPTPTPDGQAIPAWAQSRVLNEVPVKKGDKVFALTFDDGPWPTYTRQILKILKEHDVKATFFMVGSVVREYPQIAREVKAAGHAIGNHSWSHPSRPRDAVGEIRKTDAALRDLGVSKTTLFRPPYGMLKNGLAKQAMKDKQVVLIWSADSNDWKRPGANRIANAILNQATPGGIALMHDGGGAREGTVAALPRIISELKERGYKLVTVPELLKHRYIAPPKPKKTPQVKKVQTQSTQTPTPKNSASP